MTPVVFPFGEGRTEEVVFDFLRRKGFFQKQGQAFRGEFVSVRGKNNFKKEIKNIVQSEIHPTKDVRILVFRDLDAGESPTSVVQAFDNLVGGLLSNWKLQPNVSCHLQYSNIHVWTQPPSAILPGLRLVLHLADIRTLSLPVALPNHTTDGYVLAAGLTKAVLERFAQEVFATKVKSNGKTLRDLITQSIPAMVKSKKITFTEDKDYLAAYLCATRFWAVHRTEDQARLVRIILERAWKYDQATVRQVFATWRAATEEALK